MKKRKPEPKETEKTKLKDKTKYWGPVLTTKTVITHVQDTINNTIYAIDHQQLYFIDLKYTSGAQQKLGS